MGTRKITGLVRSRTLTLDPGVSTGWAVFSPQGDLEAAGLIKFEGSFPKSTNAFPSLKDVKKIVIEKPRIYDRKQWKGDPNDLISVALIGGFCAGVGFRDMCINTRGEREIKYVYPQTWKGGRPKNVDNKYTLSLLGKDEQLILNRLGLAKDKLHNVIDAVGIGLWAVGRR